MASDKHRGIGTPNTLDTQGLSSLSKSLKHEATKLSTRAVPETLPRVYPSRRRISCSRCFPDGCGSNGVAQQANFSKANGSEHKISSEEGMSFEETIKSYTHKYKAVVEILARVYPPRRSISATRCFPKDCGRKIPQAQARKKVGPEALACKENYSISQHGSMDQQLEEVPMGLRLPACREIVLGLMASGKFAGKRGKGEQRLNLTGGIVKGKKH